MLESQKYNIKNKKQNQSQKLKNVYMKFILKIEIVLQDNSRL